MKKITLISLMASSILAVQARESLPLQGTWQFAMGDTPVYNDSIVLPGSMLTNGKGNDVDANTKWTGSLYDMSYYHTDRYAPYREEGNIKFPFFLTPDKEYVGKAFYKREVAVPVNWKGKRIILNLERPHIETTVRINGKTVGHDMSLSTPHRFDVTDFVTPGGKDVLEIEIYNGIENVCVGQDSHSVTDQTQGNWNGIVGDISLTAVPAKLSIDRVRVYPEVAKGIVTVKAICTGKMPKKPKATASLKLRNSQSAAIRANKATAVKGDTVIFTIPINKYMALWSEHHPNVYEVDVTVGEDSASTVTGLRDIATGVREITLNGIPVLMRGTVENCCFPLTGYPPTDVESWAKIFAKCKEYGINMMRFHSYCPPEAAFTAADSIGVYLQPEGPSWPNHGVKLGTGMAIDKYLLDESKRIVDSYGNHPSFVMMAAGNEPAGPWVEYCADWVKEMKNYDPTKIYSSASVGGGWQWDYGSEYNVKGGGRGLTWSKSAPGCDDDYTADILHPRNFSPSPGSNDTVNTSPILAHEKGQWCAFPDLDETSQYTGPYKAKNFEIFRDLLYKNGMKGMERKFLMASGRLQALCYKYEIERNLRTPDYPGFQLLALNDYSGQGTALEGVLNVFWREKGYIDSDTWRQWCAPVVLLARLPKFVYTSSQSLVAPIEAVNATESPLSPSSIICTVVDENGDEVWSKSMPTSALAIGKGNKLGTVNMPLSSLAAPAKYTLVASMGEGDGAVSNSWDFWVYPDSVSKAVPEGIYVADSLDNKALETLRAGGKVLLTAAGKITLGDDVVQHYMPVFWNTSWFKMRPPHTTGLTIDKSHPLFAHGFPTDDWSNLNWWELVNRAQVINLCELPAEYQSPVQPIDTWHISRKLGMLVEAEVEGGKLLITTMDIDKRLDQRPVARQMRRALLDYMNSEDFAPSMKLPVETIANMFTKRTEPIQMYTNDSPDELKPKIGGR